MRSVASGKNLQVKKDGGVDASGGAGKWSKFIVCDGGAPSLIRLRSVALGKKYLGVQRGEVVVLNEDDDESLLRVMSGSGVRLSTAMRGPVVALVSEREGSWICTEATGMVSTKAKDNRKIGRFVAFTVEPCSQ